MTTISEQERMRLAQILTETNLYLRAKAQVLESCEPTVVGSERDSTNIALDLAYRAGMEKAFSEFEKLTLPPGKKPTPVMGRVIQKRTTDTDQ